MKSVFKHLLVALLILLQLFAPLVHAHAGGDKFHKGLHIPGLEAYLSNQDAPVINNVNADWDEDGLLVMMDAGIKQSQDVVADTDNSFLAIEDHYVTLSALPKCDQNFSPQSRPLNISRPFSPLSPRAPPLI